MTDTLDNPELSISEAVTTANGQIQENGVGLPAEQQQQQQQPGFSGWAMFKTLLIRLLVIYLITSFLRRPSQPTGSQSAQTAMPATNVYPRDFLIDLYVYISESKDPLKDYSHPFWLQEGLRYGDYTDGPTQDGVYIFSGYVSISESVQNNGSVFIHTFVVQNGFSPDPKSGENYSKRHTIYRSKQLSKFKKRKYHTMKNLLTGTTAVQPDLVRMENETTIEILSHWHPNLTINLVYDHTEWASNNQLPQPFDEYIEFLQGNLEYYPILYFNDYWNLNSEYMPINSTTKVLNLTLTFYHMSILKWQMYAAQGMQRGWYSYLGEDMAESNDEDQDNLKQTILETNPYLLALTIVVSLVHSVFEFLAFKNDIQFWRNRTTLEGLSVRSVFFNVFQSVIILLYVLDNDTNFIIRISIFIGLLIEMWKIHKVIDIKLDKENRIFNILPRIIITDKSTYTQSHTKEYDMLAFKYLSILLFPLLVGYAVYSVLYQEHKGWYSWVLSMLYGFLLTFGFIAMTPQLFINYKLKSVAHLPWRMLTYKALNTFIDDLFAFVIKMPMLYRLGCFRDDIVFLIYVYQRWIYRVDPKRMNEFGTCGEPAASQAQLIESNSSAVEHAANQECLAIEDNFDNNEELVQAKLDEVLVSDKGSKKKKVPTATLR